jgi:hypothetical protein
MYAGARAIQEGQAARRRHIVLLDDLQQREVEPLALQLAVGVHGSLLVRTPGLLPLCRHLLPLLQQEGGGATAVQ